MPSERIRTQTVARTSNADGDKEYRDIASKVEVRGIGWKTEKNETISPIKGSETSIKITVNRCFITKS